MRTMRADTWEPIGKAFIRGENTSTPEPLWSGYLWMPWEQAGLFDTSSHIHLNQFVPPCEGEAIITSIVSASEVEVGGTGAYVDFQGVGTLTIDGEPVEFVLSSH